MLQLSLLRSEKENVIKQLAIKNFDASQVIDEILAKDDERKAVQQKLDEQLATVNKVSKEVGILFSQRKTEEAQKLQQQSADLKESNKALSDQMTRLEQEVQTLLTTVPNIPSPEVLNGKSAEDNTVISEHGNLPSLKDLKKPHWELAKDYDLIDFELGNKIAGAGFPVYKGQGAKLQRALISFFLDKASEAGYTEVQAPLLVNEDSGFGTGQLPDKEGQMYHITEDNLYLIPTAEVPITNIFRDVILKEDELPLQYCGYTPCFRREAGSYGKDVRGLNRLHQFDKVEIVQVTHLDKSYDVLEEMVNHVKSLLEDLELPFRIVKLCGGDMSFTSALTYDFEVYSAAQEKWLEVSSVSNFGNYQANRLKLRFKDANNKKHLAHTLNGSALALPRIVAALLENNQTKDGIKVPSKLQSYMGADLIK